mgnify:CR=1 FL=1
MSNELAYIIVLSYLVVGALIVMDDQKWITNNFKPTYPKVPTAVKIELMSVRLLIIGFWPWYLIRRLLF